MLGRAHTHGNVHVQESTIKTGRQNTGLSNKVKYRSPEYNIRCLNKKGSLHNL